MTHEHGASEQHPAAQSGGDGDGSAIDRRRFVTAAAASTAAVWVAPALTTVTAAPAFAQASPVPGDEVGGVQLEDPDETEVAGTALVSDARDLPRTGNDAARVLAAGAAAIAGGAAVVRATRSDADDPTAEDAAPAV